MDFVYNQHLILATDQVGVHLEQTFMGGITWSSKHSDDSALSERPSTESWIQKCDQTWGTSHIPLPSQTPWLIPMQRYVTFCLSKTTSFALKSRSFNVASLLKPGPGASTPALFHASLQSLTWESFGNVSVLHVPLQYSNKTPWCSSESMSLYKQLLEVHPVLGSVPEWALDLSWFFPCPICYQNARRIPTSDCCMSTTCQLCIVSLIVVSENWEDEPSRHALKQVLL